MKTKLLVFKNGERFPVLLGNDGLPLFYPTVYETAMRRQINVASSTHLADLCALKVLYYWAAQNNINLEMRFYRGEFLSVNEIDSMTKAFKLRSDRFFSENDIFPVEQKNANKILKFRSKENFRLTEPKETKDGVSTKTTARRLYVVCNYLVWLARVRTTWVSERSKEYLSFLSARNEMKENIESRIPIINRYETNPRLGLIKKDQDLLLEVIDPYSPRNPWRNNFVRIRNQLYIRLLIGLGPRRGEVLILRIGRDFNAGAKTLSITRVPDDKDDTRVDEANAKTMPRDYPLDEDLTKLINDYINNFRNTIKGARRHDYLFVAAGTGVPMSKSTVTKMFHELRNSIPELPSNLCSHLLRHTWNDNFSVECDEGGVPKETEMKIRNYLNGWTDGSKSAEVYTRRTTKDKANQISLRMQKRIENGGKKKDEILSDDIPW